MVQSLQISKATNLQTFDHFLEILCVAVDTPERDAVAALVEDPQGDGAAQVPANHVLGGAVKHHGLGLLVHQNQEIVGHGQEALQLSTSAPGAVVLHVHGPGDSTQAALLGASVRPTLLLLLVGQRDEGELA